MKYSLLLLSIAVLFTVNSCKKGNDVLSENGEQTDELHFSVGEHYILKNKIPFEIKGVVYVPGYPGYLPWEIENSNTLPDNLRQSILTDIEDIKAMGANTIRFWGAPSYCYQAIKETGDLYFLQTIWIKGDEIDFHNPIFKINTKAYIRQVIDRIYTVYEDTKPPLIAYIVGNELSREGILSTDTRHPDIKSYQGRYIQTDSTLTASEAFIAEMADYTKSYEYDTYGNVSLVTYANEIRTSDIIDAPFLDFISHNAYSYAVPYYRPDTPAGSSTGTSFQGWVEKIKNKHPEIPLLITETGLSVSPNAPHAGPPDYGYGGNTIDEQAEGLMQNLTDLETATLPVAGVNIHEYLDAWWKFGLEDSYSQDPDDIEEWFGIARLIPSGDWYSTGFRNSYRALKERWEN